MKLYLTPSARTALRQDRPPPGPHKISLFFPSPAPIFILSSHSWGCSCGILVVFFEGRGPQTCTFGLSGCRVLFQSTSVARPMSPRCTRHNGVARKNATPQREPRVHRRDHAIATTWCKATEGQSKRLRGCATQQLLPTPEPRFSGELTHFGPSESEEMGNFIGPSTSCLRRQHESALPLLQQAQGTCALCGCRPAPTLPRPRWLHLAWHFRPGAMDG